MCLSLFNTLLLTPLLLFSAFSELCQSMEFPLIQPLSVSHWSSSLFAQLRYRRTPFSDTQRVRHMEDSPYIEIDGIDLLKVPAYVAAPSGPALDIRSSPIGKPTKPPSSGRSLVQPIEVERIDIGEPENPGVFLRLSSTVIEKHPIAHEGVF